MLNYQRVSGPLFLCEFRATIAHVHSHMTGAWDINSIHVMQQQQPHDKNREHTSVKY